MPSKPRIKLSRSISEDPDRWEAAAVAADEWANHGENSCSLNFYNEDGFT